MSTELMQAIRGRIKTLLDGELFDSPAGNRVEPVVCIRRPPPAGRDIRGAGRVPGVYIFRITGNLGYCSDLVQLGVIWTLHTPYDKSVDTEEAYIEAELQLDRVHDIMKSMLKSDGGRNIAGWKMRNPGVNWGTETGEQPYDQSGVAYQITATKD